MWIRESLVGVEETLKERRGPKPSPVKGGGSCYHIQTRTRSIHIE
jgi:hypothetical protein